MKKNILLQLIAILLLYCFGGYSQINITYANHAPKVGYSAIEIDSFDVFDGIDIDPCDAGPNRNRNLSSFIAHNETKISHLSPMATPFADSLAGTDVNIVIQVEEEDEEGENMEVYGFYNLSTAELVFKYMLLI